MLIVTGVIHIIAGEIFGRPILAISEGASPAISNVIGGTACFVTMLFTVHKMKLAK